MTNPSRHQQLIHDIRNALGVVDLNIQLLPRVRDDDAKFNECRKDLNEQARVLKTLIEVLDTMREPEASHECTSAGTLDDGAHKSRHPS